MANADSTARGQIWERWLQRAAAVEAKKPARDETEPRSAESKTSTSPEPATKTQERSHLADEKHSQRAFFIANFGDTPLKDDTASMEHPLFALRAGDTRIRHYERKGYKVTITPSVVGAATIHDKDLWIYAISQLVEARNRGRPISRTVRFTLYDFLMATNRPTAGVGYQRATNALRRLKGTMVETNIETGGKRERSGFGLIDAWRVIERDTDDRMVAVEITLPDWVFRSVKSWDVVTLSPDYFRLRKPLDRRIYELTRKHCGLKQPKWNVKITTLYEKSGSRTLLRKFRAAVKTLAHSNELPDYRMDFDPKADTVTFYTRDDKGGKAQFSDAAKQLKR